MNPSVNGKIQGLFKAFEFKYFSRQSLFSRTFQDSPVYSSTFQACVNPVPNGIIQPNKMGLVNRRNCFNQVVKSFR